MELVHSLSDFPYKSIISENFPIVNRKIEKKSDLDNITKTKE